MVPLFTITSIPQTWSDRNLRENRSRLQMSRVNQAVQREASSKRRPLSERIGGTLGGSNLGHCGRVGLENAATRGAVKSSETASSELVAKGFFPVLDKVRVANETVVVATKTAAKAEEKDVAAMRWRVRVRNENW